MSAMATSSLEYSRDHSLWLMPKTVGFYFAWRYAITYLFFQSDPRAGGAVEVALNLLFLVMVALYCFGPAANTLRSTMYMPCFRWVLTFLGLSLCSLTWSATLSVSVALAYWAGMAADVAMVVLLLRTGPLERMGVALMQGYVLGACCIAVITWLSPTMQDLRPGNDDFFSPNAVALILAFGVFLAQFVSRFNLSWNFVAIFLAVTLLRTLSKSTISAFIAGELLILMRDRAISRRRAFAIIAGALAVLAGFWNLIENYFEVYTTAGNQAETLTGRVGIWSYVLEHSFERPWIGHGFHSFRNVVPAFGTFEAWHAHNELLQQFYTYGIIGIFLMIALYGSLYRQARRISGSQHRALMLGLLLLLIIRGFADTDRFELTLPLWCITLLSSMLAAPQGAVPARAPRESYSSDSHRLLSFESGAPTKDGQI